MAVLRQSSLARRDKLDAERLTRLAARQHGVLGAVQLRRLGLTRAAISRWTDAGRLHRIHPGVYALGHSRLSLDGRLIAALLYGGDRAVFSHTTAAWLWSLIDSEPARMHLTVPGRRRSLPEVRMHHARRVERVTWRNLPVTPVPRTLLDLASMFSQRQLRRALAEADFRGRLHAAEIESACGKGRLGARA